jgi:PAS domain S-box-containing protein
MIDIALNDSQPVINASNSPEVIEELTKTIETYRELMVASDIGAWEYFTETGFLNCNEEYFILLGRSIKEFDDSGKSNLNESWVNLLHPEDREKAVARFEEYVNNPTDNIYESFFRMAHADGSWVWIWSRGRYVSSRQGNNIKRIIGTHTDVTASKKVEEQLQLEKILLRTLIDNLPDPIYIKDADGRKIIANIADVANIGAQSEAEVIGKTDLELFNNEIGLRGYHDDLNVIQAGKAIVNKEELFFDKAGNKHWLLTSKVPVRNEMGQVERILGIGHNITERKMNEEALNKLNEELNLQSEELRSQAQDLKLANAQLISQKEQELEKAIAQGKFEIASEVLHDIGNALVGFGSYLNRINRVMDRYNIDTIKSLALFIKSQQSALERAIGADKANALVSLTDSIHKSQAENKGEISTAVTELLNILSHIQDILSIQRQFVKGHGGSHDRKMVNLVNIIDDCKAMLLASAEKKGIQLKITIAQGEYVLKGDHTKLMQVILNVLKNSIEAIDLEKIEKIIEINLSTINGFYELKVADNGKGFDAETGNKFFKRGFTTKESGTGLGLYNCKSIIDSHDGSFQIQSDGPDLGAVTMIKLPCNSVAVQGKADL